MSRSRRPKFICTPTSRSKSRRWQNSNHFPDTRRRASNPRIGCSHFSMRCSQRNVPTEPQTDQFLARRLASATFPLRCAKGSAGTGNPAGEALGHLGFRGVVAYVQTFGLKAAAHVSGMLPAPAAPAPNARESRNTPHPSHHLRVTAPMRTRGSPGQPYPCSITQRAARRDDHRTRANALGAGGIMEDL